MMALSIINETGASGPETNTAPIFQKAVGFAVETKRLGTRRKVSSSDIQTDADRDLVHVSKSILDSPELKRVERLDGEIRRYLSTICLPSNFKSGIYLLPISLVEKADAEFGAFKVQREALVEHFVEAYESRRLEAQGRLASLFDATDYPRPEVVRDAFSLDTQYVTFDTPASLKGIKGEIFKREREKADAMWKDALEECRKLLRATMHELVGHIGERLTPKDGGKKKSFHGSMLTKLDSFMTSFEDRNIANDSELSALVKKAKTVMYGIDAEVLRKEEGVRDAFKEQMDELKGTLDSMVIDKPTRAFAADGEE
tara:strand:- start:5325 stop:6266 length:942 start_codon:yes stop_codon:yes gene_type:complete